jgi:hypothetical protein
VDVCLLEDKRIFVTYKGKVIVESKLSKNNKVIKKDKEVEEFLNAREYMNLNPASILIKMVYKIHI